MIGMVPSLAVPARWWREPQLSAGAEVCIFVTLAPGGRVHPHNLVHARAWAAAGFVTIIVLIGDDIAAEPDAASLDFAAGVLMRANQGYDFGAWAGAMARLPGLVDAAMLALVNDSIIGPTADFAKFIARARATDADHIGATMSYERFTHIQSYLQFFRPRALRHTVFQSFWREVRSGDREFVISNYEITLLRTLHQAGLTSHALFRLPDTAVLNPTIHLWRKLIDAGFPYVKLAVLRDNPAGLDLAGWRTLLASRGYDPGPIEAYLRTVPVAALRVAG